MDIVIRATVAFLFILLLTRIVGRRELNTLEPFDLILLVTIGSPLINGRKRGKRKFTYDRATWSTAMIEMATSAPVTE